MFLLASHMDVYDANTLFGLLKLNLIDHNK